MLNKIEIQTIFKVIQTLNYYQILKVGQLASETEIQEAFHKEAFCFHPDQYSTEQDQELLDMVKSIYSKVVEAYQVLGDRQKRIAYDNKLKGIDRIEENEEEDENAITAIRRRPEWATKSPGDKFFKLAEKAFQSGDYRTAKMNIQIAIGTEPTNTKFMKLKERVDLELKKS